MTLPAKVAGTAVVIGGGSLAGCYFGGVFDDTPWVSLKTENSTTNSYSGKVGEKYSIYFLAVHGSELGKADSKDFNESKWKELHKKYLADFDNEGIKKNMSSAFKNGAGGKTVSVAYDAEDGGDNKALNKVCKSIYEKEVGTEDGKVNFSKPSSDPSEGHKLAEDLLKYCSPLGQKPAFIEENEYAGSVIGAGSAKGELVSTKKSENYYFWQAQEKGFETADSGAQNNGFFRTAFKDGKLATSLKSKCEEAYNLEGSESEDSTDKKPKIDDVKKYCSFPAIV